ncbi:MAG TPA: metallophosphoesterase [Acidimicrobiales bacterium]|nr:metallophosphoesterase [Acidimicrobiales bacterium]
MRPGVRGLSLFAVEDTAVQLVWRDPPTAGAVVAAGDASATVAGPGPVAFVLDGLAPDTPVAVRVDGRPVGSVRTLAPPPGPLLCRFATVSDLHVGERAFGVLPRFRERAEVPNASSYAARGGRAALAEAAAWGAERIVAKGDLTWSGRRHHWEDAGAVLASSPVPVHATLGNHDVVPRAVDGREVLGRHGIAVARDGPEVVDLRGVRVVIGHSADAHHRFGVVDGAQRAALVGAAAASPSGAAFVTLHHYVDPLPFVSRYPKGIERASGQRLLRELAAAQPRTFLSFGHTHRHRRKVHHGMPATEVGSTKEFPGVWAGYAVHEGGIRQVVRRIAEPACLAWTERTAASVLGLWGPWAAGRLAWRCFSWTWPPR